MKKRIFTLITTMIGMTLYTQKGLATNLVSQCKLDVPRYNGPLIHSKTSEFPVIITADSIKGNYPDNTTFIGNVKINQGDTYLEADEVQLHQSQLNGTTELIRTVDAIGNVYYDDNQVILKGAKAWSNLNTKDTNVWKGNYQIVGRQSHGKANIIKQRGKTRYTILKNGSFTSCLPGYEAWSIVGSKVIYDHIEQVAKIWNARFKIGPITIFYSPYLQLSTGDQRHSGFLIPDIKYSIKNYFEVCFPYYWKLSPNIDVTIAPRYIQKRGNIGWENKLRYLTREGMGLIELYYLPSDKIFKSERSIVDSNHRSLYYWQHSSKINQTWHFNVNYTKVSDPYYFNDFSSKYGSDADDYTTQIFNIGYTIKNFDATISTRRFQILTRQIANTYCTQPDLSINWYQSNIGPFDLQIYGQVDHFVNTDASMPKATRFHIEPIISFPWSNNWANLNTEVKLMVTHYLQKNLDNYNTVNNMDLKESVNRILPQFKVNGKLTFERDIDPISGYTQTIEPRVQYLYIPYRDQRKINNYDSSLLHSDYGSLFRDRIYSGLDRISSSNKITAGVTSHIFDSNAVEHFNIFFGQAYSVAESSIHDHNPNWKNNNKTNSFVWAGNTYWRITDCWSLCGDMQYDTHLDTVTTSNAYVKYCRDKYHTINLSYHYVSPEYIQETSPGCAEAKQYNQGISQVGGEASFLLADQLEVDGAYYFDFIKNKAANQKLGLQYNSCCYAVRIGYERKLNNWNPSSNQSGYDNIVGFNIKLRGLNSSHSLNSK